MLGSLLEGTWSFMAMEAQQQELDTLCLHHEAKNKQEGEVSYKTSVPTPTHLLSGEKLYLLKVLDTFSNSISSWGRHFSTHSRHPTFKPQGRVRVISI